MVDYVPLHRDHALVFTLRLRSEGDVMDWGEKLFVDLKKPALILLKVVEHKLFLAISYHKSELLVEHNILNEAHVFLAIALGMGSKSFLMAGPFLEFIARKRKMGFEAMILYLIHNFIDTVVFAKATYSNLLVYRVFRVFRNQHCKKVSTVRKLDLCVVDPRDNDLPDCNELTFVLEEESKNKAWVILFLNLAEAFGSWATIDHVRFYQLVLVLWQHALG